jgi:cytochrome oxidase Cu insertion factor (SCO1/SenC/PrrC family)
MKVNRQHLLWSVLVVALLGLTAAALWLGPDHRLFGGGDPARDANSERAGGAPEPGDGGSGGTSGGPARLEDLGAVPAFTLVSQTGATVQRTDLDGQVWIADFIFTSCKGTCPMMSAQMRRVDEMLARERGVKLVSFSVDPERDTPQRLAEYGAEFGARPERWIFLTGDKAALRDLSITGFHLPASEASTAEVAAGQEIITHSTRFVLVDRAGHIRGYYSGTDANAVQQLVEDARRLLASRAG